MENQKNFNWENLEVLDDEYYVAYKPNHTSVGIWGQ